MLIFNLAHLIAMPMIGEIEQRRFAQTQGLVAMQVLALAADTRKAYYAAVAAGETVRYTRQVMQAAEASAELARRMQQVGNFNKLQRAREQSFYADAALNLARAEQAAARGARAADAAARRLGCADAYTLPERLPDLPPTVAELPDIEARGDGAAAGRARRKAGRRADGQEPGPDAHHALRQRARGRRHPQQLQRRAVAARLRDRLRAAAVRLGRRARGQGRGHLPAGASIAPRRPPSTHAPKCARPTPAYRSAYDIARHYRDEIVPLRKQIAEENLLRYNGMLIGVFELLADARAQIASVNNAIDALRDFWIAQADLDMALIGKPNLTAAAGPAMAAEAGAAGH